MNHTNTPNSTVSVHDLNRMTQLPLNLPEGSKIIVDSAYTDCLLE
jgi:hypothetical protein